MTLLSRLFGAGEAPPIVNVVRLYGVIGAGTGPFSQGLSLARLATPIERAFGDRRAAAVALQINSPGGSAVQSALIGRRIRELAEEKKKPVFAFVEDAAASGGYWLASAADEIWADASSIVGSIGVVAAGFGFQDLIQRHGVERRMHTAGTRKRILDAFEPERPEDVAKLEQVLRDIHRQFIDQVRERRGAKLTADDATLFEGEFWTGARGVELGLIDGLGHLRTVLRQKYGPKVRLRLIESPRGWLRRRLGGSEIAGRLIGEALGAIEERALWQRYGL